MVTTCRPHPAWSRSHYSGRGWGRQVNPVSARPGLRVFVAKALSAGRTGGASVGARWAAFARPPPGPPPGVPLPRRHASRLHSPAPPPPPAAARGGGLRRGRGASGRLRACLSRRRPCSPLGGGRCSGPRCCPGRPDTRGLSLSAHQCWCPRRPFSFIFVCGQKSSQARLPRP